MLGWEKILYTEKVMFFNRNRKDIIETNQKLKVSTTKTKYIF